MKENVTALISSVLNHPSSKGKNTDEIGKSLTNILESHDFLNKNEGN